MRDMKTTTNTAPAAPDYLRAARIMRDEALDDLAFFGPVPSVTKELARREAWLKKMEAKFAK